MPSTAAQPVKTVPCAVTPTWVATGMTVLLAAVVVVAAAVGLFAGGGPGPHTVTSLRGQAVELYGTGLYRHDTWLVGVGNRGTDAVTLFAEVPALLLCLVAWRRRSLRGAVGLLGVLGWMLYYYASMSLATAYNRMFPLYVVAFSLALFALPLVLSSIDPLRFAAVMPERPSPRTLVVYLGALALVLTVAWAPALVVALVTGKLPPRLDTYTTPVTWALDLGVVMPMVLLVAVMLHRRLVRGPLAAAAMLALNVALGIALVGQGIAQLASAVPISTGEVVAAMVSFAVMTAVAAVLLVPLLMRLPSPEQERELATVTR